MPAPPAPSALLSPDSAYPFYVHAIQELEDRVRGRDGRPPVAVALSLAASALACAGRPTSPSDQFLVLMVVEGAARVSMRGRVFDAWSAGRATECATRAVVTDDRLRAARAALDVLAAAYDATREPILYTALLRADAACKCWTRVADRARLQPPPHASAPAASAPAAFASPVAAGA